MQRVRSELAISVYQNVIIYEYQIGRFDHRTICRIRGFTFCNYFFHYIIHIIFIVFNIYSVDDSDLQRDEVAFIKVFFKTHACIVVHRMARHNDVID